MNGSAGEEEDPEIGKGKSRDLNASEKRTYLQGERGFAGWRVE